MKISEKTGLVIIEFIKPYGAYTTGSRAGFLPEVAEGYVRSGYAKHLPKDAAPRPEDNPRATGANASMPAPRTPVIDRIVEAQQTSPVTNPPRIEPIADPDRVAANLSEAQDDDDHDGVVIPEGWEELTPSKMKSLAKKIDPNAQVKTEAEAMAVIKAEADRRAQPPAE